MKYIINIFIIIVWALQNANAEYITQTIPTKEGVPPYSQIYSLETDTNGYIYIATDNGLYIYNGAEIEVFHPSLIGNNRQFIGFYKDGNNIYALPLNYKIIKITNGRTHQFKEINYGNNNYSVFSAYTNANNELEFIAAEEYTYRSLLRLTKDDQLILKEKQINQFDVYKKLIAIKTIDSNQQKLNKKLNSCEKPLLYNNQFLFLNSEIFKIGNGKSRLIIDIEKYKLEGSILRYFQFNDNEFAISIMGKNYGIYRFNNNRLDTLYNKEPCTGITQDKFQNIWISTLNGKLLKINKFVTTKSKQNFKPLSDIVNVLSPCDNILFISDMNANLYELNLINGNLKLLVKATSNYNKQNNLYKLDGFTFYTNNKSIYQFKENKLINTTPLPITQQESSVRVYTLNGQKVYINNFHMEYLPKGFKKLERIITSIRINQIEKDEYENLWIASQSGLFTFNLNKKISFQKYITNTAIDSTSVNSIILLKSYLFLLCNGIIYKYNIANKSIEKIYTDKLIKSLLLLDNNIIGITQHGYKIFNISLENISSFEFQKDMINEKIKNAYCDHKQLILLNNSQLFIIPKSDLSLKNNEETNLIITKATFNNSLISIDNNTNSFSSKWEKSNQFKIDFDLLNNFISDFEIGTYSLLLGKDTLIKNTKLTNNSININNLLPGNYTILIQLKNNINHRIFYYLQPQFYQTKLFILISILLSGLLIFFIASWISRKLQLIKFNNQLQQSKLLQLESTSRLNQLNPHFIFNALTPLQNYIITSEKDKAAKYLTHFSSLLRKMLIISRKSTISIHEEIQFLQEYLYIQSVEKDHSFKYTINNCLSEKDSLNCMIPNMMIQPLVENAINHGMDLRKNQMGLLEITFEKINTSQLKITIFDNGEGFEINEIEKIKANHAIDIINERLELINKTTKKELNNLTFQKTGKGFESIIILPTTFF